MNPAPITGLQAAASTQATTEPDVGSSLTSRSGSYDGDETEAHTMSSAASISAPGPRSPSGMRSTTLLVAGSIRRTTRSRCGTTQTDPPDTATPPPSHPSAIAAVIDAPAGAAMGSRGRRHAVDSTEASACRLGLALETESGTLVGTAAEPEQAARVSTRRAAGALIEVRRTQTPASPPTHAAWSGSLAGQL